jgi:nucleoside-diphosphate-sugar epimerase
MQPNNENILVLGGTGKTGRRVAERLAAHGVPTRIGSRSGEPPFDWEDHLTWAGVLDGVTSAYVSYYPDLAIPAARRRRSRPSRPCATREPS